jgi:hypothetical protein
VQLGEFVNGLMMDPEWRFVTADAHDVHIAVNRHDRNARLVGTPKGRVAVARFIERAKLDENIEDVLGKPVNDRGGAWLLVFHPKRPDGSEWVGEPDSTIVTQLQQRDVWARRRGVNERELLSQFERMQEVQEARQQERARERMRAHAEEAIFGWAKQYRIPWRPSRIYVPAGVNGGGHRH